LRHTRIEPDARLAAHAEILDRVRRLPGVSAAAEAFIPPMSGSSWNQPIVIGGAVQKGTVHFNQVSGEYFALMGMPVIAGRTFESGDRLGAPKAAIVNHAFVQRYFPGTAPLGRTFQFEPSGAGPQPDFHVVGVVKNTKYVDLREEFMPIVYLAASQDAEPGPALSLVVRSDLPPGSLTPSVTRAITAAAPGASVTYYTVSGSIRESLRTERLMASLSGFFGGLAMIIAVVGLYGVMSYLVTRRRGEIGIRMALGADPRAVVRMVLTESGVLVAVGIVAGGILAIVLSRWAQALLYALKPWDPPSFALAAATLALVSLAAAWVPARRASRVSPATALRE
jgi:putative ABC transport system permease protein